MKINIKLLGIVFLFALFSATSAQASLASLGTKLTIAMSDLPRYEKLPPFDPHRKDFTCVYESQRMPPVDPQAEMWFQQAVAMNDPNVLPDKIDYGAMYQLYLQAAQRNHPKAMLNLASLILRERPGVPVDDSEVAIGWVEKAMKLGSADAYDRMGVYHLNGLIKGGDATSAYAFFQRAADMGSPEALTFLGDKLAATYDNPAEGFWGNLPVGTKMLECAFAQGYGPAADKLSYIYRGTTQESKNRALHVLHEGVKLGCWECADNLFTQFDGYGLTRGVNLIGHVDKARAERYNKIGDVLKLYDGRLKLPNLDKVLPLPPAALPKWDGNVQTLINAAKAVTIPQKGHKDAALEGRAFVPAGYAVRPLEAGAEAVTAEQQVPQTGYWVALLPGSTTSTERPQRYEAGERFERAGYDWVSPDQVQWHYVGDVYRLPPQPSDFVDHLVSAGAIREVTPPSQDLECSGNIPCPATGIWGGRVDSAHAMKALFNRVDQQAFVAKGERFPQPHERVIEVDSRDVVWTYLGNPNREEGGPGIHAISL
ncbi:SEL1-like repeat protein [Paraburkholderia bannensis]|uniref:SEL1-like repeat protein n=1 Tax=Paraburkholderia bannensis TaxID=765414 RepID=UPI002AC337C8|nr:DUF6396 domain-containing protein [Paraburkholderia bannensis]